MNAACPHTSASSSSARLPAKEVEKFNALSLDVENSIQLLLVLMDQLDEPVSDKTQGLAFNGKAWAIAMSVERYLKDAQAKIEHLHELCMRVAS